MLIFTNLTLKRGITTLLENANATITRSESRTCRQKRVWEIFAIFTDQRQLLPEQGDVTYPNSWQISWVNQETPALEISALDYTIQGDREYTQLQQQLAIANQQNDGYRIAAIHSQLDAIDAWTIQSRASTLLHGLGFEESQLSLPVKSFSGGWRMRLNLAQALLCRSDLLLLDEPTNHLDLDAVIWLESWLKSYSGTLVLISHDRDFLDPIINKVII